MYCARRHRKEDAVTVLLKLDLHARPGKRDEVIAVIEEFFREYPVIDGYRGDGRISVNPEVPDHILVVETWDTEQHHRAWAASAQEAIDAKLMPIIESSSTVGYWPVVWPD
jgi:heme-degrading monooxygenase HmoA